MYKDFLKNQLSQWDNNPVTESAFNNKQVFIFDGDIVPFQKTVYSENRELKTDEYSKIHSTLYPEPLVGNLNTGKIFLCNLNPGFGGSEYNTQNQLEDCFREQFLQSDNNSFFWILDCAKGTAGYNFWTKKINQKNPQGASLLENIKNNYRKNSIVLSDVQIYEMLSKLFVSIEVFPYHTKKTPTEKLVKSFNSVKEMKNFVHNELIPNAQKENYLICFLRAIRYWDLTDAEKNNPNVICNRPELCEASTLSVYYPMGEKILEHLSKLTDRFTKVI